MNTEIQRIKYNPDDYLYSTANIHALENSIISYPDFVRMAQAQSETDVLGMLSELGVNLSHDYESELDRMLCDAYDSMQKLCPNPEFVRIFRYIYDCHNVKSIIKSEFCSAAPQPLLFDIGSVDKETLVTSVRERRYTVLPHNMAIACEKAYELYAKTGDPQHIDAELDSACYKDMLELAESTGNGFYIGLIRTKIDIANILTTVRIIRMSDESIDAAYLRKMLICGGKLDAEMFVSSFYDGESALWGKLASTDFCAVANEMDSQNSYSLTKLETSLEKYQTEYVKKAKYILAGPEAVCAYLLGTENEVKNIRIIITGKRSGLDPDTIKERLRESYV